MPHKLYLLALTWVISGSISGCAVNFAEMRGAHVLGKGESQVTQANIIVAPTAAIRETIDPARVLVENAPRDESFSKEEISSLVGASAAISLTSPGYGTYIEYARGVGHGLEFTLRSGNGIHAIGGRVQTWETEHWASSLGARVGYNSGGTWIPYVSVLERFVPIGEVKRMDASLNYAIGRKLKEWGRLWAGGKWTASPYKITLYPKTLGLEEESTSGRITYGGIYLGAGVGYKVVHFNVELSLLKSYGSVDLYGETYSLNSFVLAPAWGFQVTF
jgi:hypothetical protein